MTLYPDCTVLISNLTDELDNRRSVHLLKCQSSEKGQRGNWHTLLSGEVGAVRASSRYLLVACKDATFNVFTPAGQRRFPVSVC